MIIPWRKNVPQTHEDVFLEHYAALKRRAVRLAQGDSARAEDLLHDVFVQFTLARPELGAIDNTEAYLFAAARNLYISQSRLAVNNRLNQLSIYEYDSAEIGLRAVYSNSDEIITAQHELRQVCRYACARKDSSVVGSILILRFFQGYFPSEIALISKSNRRAVDERLRIARLEANTFIENPADLIFLKKHPKIEPFPANFALRKDDFLVELRRFISASITGSCFSAEEIEEIYVRSTGAAPDSKQLAHLAACPLCLDKVNAQLGLPPLAERHPADYAGRDDDSSGGGASGGKIFEMKNQKFPKKTGDKKRVGSFERRLRETYEHRPAELFVAVNGVILGSQKIASVLNEQTLECAGSQSIKFVEVISEQRIRLLLFSVSEEIPFGGGTTHSRVELSDGRWLEMTLDCASASPNIRAVYCDPLMSSEEIAADLRERRQSAAADEFSIFSQQIEVTNGFWSKLAAFFGNHPLWTSACASVLIIALLAAFLFKPAPISAAEILRRSVQAEQTFNDQPDSVIKQLLAIKEIDITTGEALKIQKAEIWTNHARRAKAVRLFDEANRLIGGEWSGINDSSRLYISASAARDESLKSRYALDFRRLQQFNLSAANYLSFFAVDDLTTQESATEIAISGKRDIPATENGLISGDLVLRRSDFIPVRQTIILREAGALRKFEIAALETEKIPAANVPANVFTPELELLGTKPIVMKSSSPPPPPIEAGKPPLADQTIAEKTRENIEPEKSNTASADLEVEIIYLLDKIRATTGEQIEIKRNLRGQIELSGIVDSENRRREILSALSSVSKNSAVKINLLTTAEALERLKPGQEPASQDIPAASEIQADRRIAASDELRRYLTANGTSPSDLDIEVRRFAGQTIAVSNRAMSHIYALKRLSEQFTPEQVQSLSPDARNKREEILRNQAAVYLREVKVLRDKIEPVFGKSAAGPAAEITTEAELRQAIRQLLQAAQSCDQFVRAKFSLSAGGAATNNSQVQTFQQSLMRDEGLARTIENAKNLQ